GEEERIRPCVGATYCSWHRRCIHNPAIGREAQLPHVVAPAAAKKRVVVIGAGPAGLEAARVAAERGHEVIVFEAASQPGGQVRLTAQSARRREMMGIIDWRMAQCQARGVAFLFDTYAQENEVLRHDPNVVIIATGGLPHTEVLKAGNEW